MKWRKIKNNMIQTWTKEVFIWDNKEGVAIRPEVPSRPWKNLPNDYVAWMDAEGFDVGMFPGPPLELIDDCRAVFSDGSLIDNGRVGDISELDSPF